jgi:hypothetical protein
MSPVPREDACLGSRRRCFILREPVCIRPTLTNSASPRSTTDLLRPCRNGKGVFLPAAGDRCATGLARGIRPKSEPSGFPTPSFDTPTLAPPPPHSATAGCGCGCGCGCGGNRGVANEKTSDVKALSMPRQADRKSFREASWAPFHDPRNEEQTVSHSLNYSVAHDSPVSCDSKSTLDPSDLTRTCRLLVTQLQRNCDSIFPLTALCDNKNAFASLPHGWAPRTFPLRKADIRLRTAAVDAPKRSTLGLAKSTRTPSSRDASRSGDIR